MSKSAAFYILLSLFFSLLWLATTEDQCRPGEGRRDNCSVTAIALYHNPI